MCKSRELTGTEARAVWCSQSNGKGGQDHGGPKSMARILHCILQQQQPRKISEPKLLSFAFRKGTAKAR